MASRVPPTVMRYRTRRLSGDQNGPPDVKVGVRSTSNLSSEPSAFTTNSPSVAQKASFVPSGDHSGRFPLSSSKEAPALLTIVRHPVPSLFTTWIEFAALNAIRSSVGDQAGNRAGPS
jgi:hypothetical protein